MSFSVESNFGSVATIADDADLTMGGAMYTREDVLGKGLYNRGADTLTYVGDGIWLADPDAPLFIDANFNAHAIVGPNASNDVESTGVHEYACLELLNGWEEYLLQKKENT